MGDMADDALDNAFDDLDHYEKYRNAPLNVQYEEGLIDEFGGTIGAPWSIPAASSYKSKKPSGPGLCPLCEGPTHKIEGANGVFYGCDKFPKCKGSRNK